MAQPAPPMIRGIVKQVLSGDSVIIRGQPKGGPPPERQLCLSNITAPKLARRANPNVESSTATNDEPFAWEAREFLRTRLIGKEVLFSVEYKVPGTGREYGCIFLKNATGELENVTEAIVAEGLVEVRRGGIKPSDEQTKLIDLEEHAKTQGKGRWANDASEHVRKINWSVENPRHFLDTHTGKEIPAIVEHVRDGCTVRLFLLPEFYHITVMLSGIKSPMFKREGDKEFPEPFADEAKFFTESRLLQREVKVILEGVSNTNFLGTVIHPAGNISELLLREGFARCVDWSMAVLSKGHDILRAAEKLAKEKRIRIWKEYVPSTPAIEIKDQEFSGKVLEIVNADAVVVRHPSGKDMKIHLSSVRPPRVQPKEDAELAPVAKESKRSRPLYDIPYMFEAREFMRKKLVGKKVNVKIDYIKLPNDGFPERTCATITIGGVNVAEALVSKGFVTVLRHRQDDDQRSSHYDELLAAETRAVKNGKGLHSKKEPPIHRVADLSGEAAKAKQFLPFLQRAGRSSAIVEFVASGSRMRLYLPKETCLVTFLLAGISCPRAGRIATSQGVITNMDGDAFGDEAQRFTKDMVMQREVEVEVEGIDKAGNFIGWMFVDDKNLSVALVESGLSSVHFSAERTSFYHQLSRAEELAKQQKLKMWAKYEEPKDVVVVEETERKCNYKKIIVTEFKNELTFYAQLVETGPQLEQLMTDLNTELGSSPPLPGSFTARKGEMCAARFVDNSWYRAKIESVKSPSEVSVFYVDYGNREVLPVTRLCPLPSAFIAFPNQAKEFTLAFVELPKDPDQAEDAMEELQKRVLNRQFLLNVEYKNGGQEFVSVMTEGGDDVGKSLVADGFVLVEKRKEKRLQKMMEEYRKAQDTARTTRLNLWRYGDFTEDDAREFGYPN
ncbi:staphylococcal nuclease domain-containing protein 1 [Nematostella vectensis]|uniref:staphylococcal nuclease domain-containing protein 1 n=1 Tax=Nematostella vectensis TaxID=45351 RepID=UPI002077100D|nr:staphylococcal nuclease domain-containing protein 1 [Nematostella vectensis]